MPDSTETPRPENGAVYVTLRLHTRSPDSWAVIERRTGAIVMADDGTLVFRLSRESAARVADELNARGRTASPTR